MLFKPATNSTEKKEEAKPLWWVPLTYTTSVDMDFERTHPSHWLKAEPSITISGLPSNKDWIIFNILQTGNYCINFFFF